MRWIHRSFAALAAAGLASTSLFGPVAAFADTGDLITATSWEDACDTADTLIGDKEYDEAIALIDSIRKVAVDNPQRPELSALALACDAEWTTATLRKASRTPTAEEKASAETDQAAAGARCEIAADVARRDPKAAIDYITALRGEDAKSTLCEDQRLIALRLQANGPDGRAGDVGRTWAGAVTHFAEPLAPPIVAWLALAAALLILGRALSRAPGIRDGQRRATDRRAVIVLAVLLTAAAPTLLVVGFSSAQSGWPGTIGVLALGVLLAPLAAVACAGALASRLRIEVEVLRDGKEDRAALARMVALLGALGARGPRGVEVPLGPDVSALDGALELTGPTGQVWQGVVNVVKAVIGGRPWSVTISMSGSTDPNGDDGPVATVIVSRNGVTVEQWRVVGSELGLPAEVPVLRALEVVAAAKVLISLAAVDDRFDALGRAPKAESIALQFLAVKDFETSDGPRSTLIAKALEIDSTNGAARLSKQYYDHRESVTQEQLDRYLGWLDREIIRLAHPDQRLGSSTAIDLEIRARVTRALIAVNRQATIQLDAGSFEIRVGEAIDLVGLLDALPTATSDDRTLPERRRRAAAVALRMLASDGRRDPRPADEQPKAEQAGSAWPTLPSGLAERYAAAELASESWLLKDRDALDQYDAYNAACRFVFESRELVGAVRAEIVAAALDLLELAVESDELRGWAPKDPTLRSVWAEPRFRRIVKPKPKPKAKPKAPTPKPKAPMPKPKSVTTP